jgi:hypothetical protein
MTAGPGFVAVVDDHWCIAWLPSEPRAAPGPNSTAGARQA